MECNFKRHTWVATHSSGHPAAVALATQPFSGLTITVLKGQTLIVNTLQPFPIAVIMHTVGRVGSVIKENYSTWRASVSSPGPVFATSGLCYWISIVDASVGVVPEDNGGGQIHKEMLLNTQNPSQEQQRHRGRWRPFSCFCQKQMSTWSLAALRRTIKPIEMLPFTSI